MPKLRSGSYFPEWLLERRKRAEAALVSVVATCYLLGVSTRRMDKLVQTLGITSLSKSQVSRMAADLDAQVAAFRTRPLHESGPFTFVAADALTMKVREQGRVVNAVVLVATGVNADGHREVLGVKVATSETKQAWNAFFADLVARGLTGALLVTSDAHAGLVDAIAANLPGAIVAEMSHPFRGEPQAVCPKSAWPAVKTMLHSVYDQPDAAAVHAQFDKLLDTTARSLPKVAAYLDDARADLLAFTGFPQPIWRQIWSNNTTNGPKAAATSPSTSSPRPATHPPPPRLPPGTCPNWRPPHDRRDRRTRHPRPGRTRTTQRRPARRQHRDRLLGRPKPSRTLARRHQPMATRNRRPHRRPAQRTNLLTSTTRKISRYTTSRGLTGIGSWSTAVLPGASSHVHIGP